MGLRKRFNKAKNVRSANRVKRRNGGSHKEPKVPQSKVETWEDKKTLIENYKANKIAYDINAAPEILENRKDLLVKDDLLNHEKDFQYFKRLRDIQGGEENGENLKQKFFFKKSQEWMNSKKKKQAKISKDEGLIVRKLIKKYGDDVTKMRRDIKVNKNQWTENQCKQKIRAYNKRFGDGEISFIEERYPLKADKNISKE